MAKILVEYGEMETIAKMLNVARKTVSEALSGQTHTALANKIRKLALLRGGVVKPRQTPTV